MALTKTNISELYVALFNRASEGVGNSAWQGYSSDAAHIATTMLATSAAQEYFGSNLDSNQAFVEHIYQNTLNKTLADDPDGIAAWVGKLESNEWSRGEMVVKLIETINLFAPGGDYYASADETTKDAYKQFANRVEVSDYMADSVYDTPSDYATSTSFSGDLVVTFDDSTKISAKSTIETVLAIKEEIEDNNTNIEEIDNNNDGITDEIKYFDTNSKLIEHKFDKDFNETFERINAYEYLDNDNVVISYYKDEGNLLYEKSTYNNISELNALETLVDQDEDGTFDYRATYSYNDDGTVTSYTDIDVDGVVDEQTKLYDQETFSINPEACTLIDYLYDSDGDGTFDEHYAYNFTGENNSIEYYDGNNNGIFEKATIYNGIVTPANFGTLTAFEEYEDNDEDGIYDTNAKYEYLDNGNVIVALDYNGGIDEIIDQRNTFKDSSLITTIESYADRNSDGSFDNYNQYDDYGRVLVVATDTNYDSSYDNLQLVSYNDDGTAISLFDFTFNSYVDRKIIYDASGNYREVYDDSDTNGNYDTYQTYDIEGTLLTEETGDFGVVGTHNYDISTLLI